MYEFLSLCCSGIKYKDYDAKPHMNQMRCPKTAQKKDKNKSMGDGNVVLEIVQVIKGGVGIPTS